MKLKSFALFFCIHAILISFLLPLNSQEEKELKKSLSAKDYKLYKEGEKLQKEGELDLSRDKFEMVYVDIKENYFIINKLAQIYAQRKEYDKAAELFEKAVKVRKEKGIKDAAVFNSLGWVYIMKNDYDKAKKYLELSLAHIDELPESYKIKTYNNLGTLYVNLEEYSKAEEYLTIAADDYNSSLAKRNLQFISSFILSNKNKYFNLAEKAFERKDFDSTVQYLKSAVKVAPKDKQLFYEAGKFYIKMKKYNEAIESFKKALDLDPKFFQAQEELMAVYYMLGRKEEAKKVIHHEKR